MPIEVHRDISSLAFGTHKRGANSASLVVPGADFASCGVSIGSLMRNTTDGSECAITAVTEDEVQGTLSGGTNNFWSVGDSYEIYITSAYNTRISDIYTDRSRGWKTDRDKLHEGWRPEDEDLDRYNRNVFSPGQPTKDKI